MDGEALFFILLEILGADLDSWQHALDSRQAYETVAMIRYQLDVLSLSHKNSFVSILIAS